MRLTKKDKQAQKNKLAEFIEDIPMINKLIELHNLTFFRVFNKCGEILSLTKIDCLEYDEEKKYLHLERKLKDEDKYETLITYAHNFIQDIDYKKSSAKDENGDVLLINVVF